MIAGAFFSKETLGVGVIPDRDSERNSIGALFKKTIFKSKESQFLIEPPPYRMPTTKAHLFMFGKGKALLGKSRHDNTAYERCAVVLNVVHIRSADDR